MKIILILRIADFGACEKPHLRKQGKIVGDRYLVGIIGFPTYSKDDYVVTTQL
ncbi:MAG: hypothetical protein WCA35_08560 [Kovacikia sp.]